MRVRVSMTLSLYVELKPTLWVLVLKGDVFPRVAVRTFGANVPPDFCGV